MKDGVPSQISYWVLITNIFILAATFGEILPVAIIVENGKLFENFNNFF